MCFPSAEFVIIINNISIPHDVARLEVGKRKIIEGRE
jgi:hypothetical protein